MNQLKESYKLIHKVKDTSFSIDDLTHYSLSLLIGVCDFQFCVSDTRNHRCLLVEDYLFETPLAGGKLGDSLYRLFESHTLLMAGYWKSIQLAVKNQKFTLLPAKLFSVPDLRHYLHMSAEVDKDDGFYYYNHRQSDMVMAFAASKGFVERIKSIYPTQSVQVLHQGSALIEGIQQNQGEAFGQHMYLYFGKAHFNIMITKNGKLLFYNRFAYQQAQDVVRYTMMVMDEMQIDRHTDQVQVWTSSETERDLFGELYQYVRHLSYGSRPSYMKFSYAFDEIPDHQYFDLYSLYTCQQV